jgi:hypothetical protein
LVPRGQKAPTNTDHFFIDIYHDSFLHRLVCQDFPQGSALASPGDEYPLWPGMRKHSWMYQRFMVDKFVRLAGLNLAIEYQANAEAARIDNLYGLKLGSP